MENEATKLWNMETVSFGRWQNQGEEVAYTHYELSLRLDLETNAFLTSFVNPYTNETLDMELAPFGPNITLLSATSARVPDDAPIKPTLTHDIGPPVILDDDIWMPQDLFAALPAFAPDAPPWRANDITTYKGKLSEVLDDDIASAPATCTYQGFYAWRPWLNMGARSGHHLARMSGRKLNSIEDIPRSYRDIVEKEKPDFLDNPEAALGMD